MIKKQPDLKYCDICKKSIDGVNGASNGRLTIGIDGLDFAGHAVGDASSTYRDVCDSCIYAVRKYVDSITK